MSFTFSPHGNESIHCNNQGIRVVKELLELVQAAPPNRCGLKHHHPQKIQSSGAEKVEVMSALIIEQICTNISGKQNTLCQEPDACIVYALWFDFLLWTTSCLVLMA